MEAGMDFGAGVTIKGEIVATENLHIGGRVEGTIRLLEGAALTLAAGSVVVGNITAANVTVLGQVDGDITATDRLLVRSTAVIEGTLISPRLGITDGAQFEGWVEMPTAEPKAASKDANAERAAVVAFPVAV
jgi:cytoskeletal protein CcmA (bactofilin family)